MSGAVWCSQLQPGFQQSRETNKLKQGGNILISPPLKERTVNFLCLRAAQTEMKHDENSPLMLLLNAKHVLSGREAVHQVASRKWNCGSHILSHDKYDQEPTIHSYFPIFGGNLWTLHSDSDCALLLHRLFTGKHNPMPQLLR